MPNFQDLIYAFLQSSTEAVLGIFIVFEIAPDINGCDAAIISIWLLTDKKRLPILPHMFAQSKTGKCSSFISGEPSNVMAPQINVLAISI